MCISICILHRVFSRDPIFLKVSRFHAAVFSSFVVYPAISLSPGNRGLFSAAKLFCPTSIRTYKITSMCIDMTNSRATPISTCTMEFTLWPLSLNEHQFCYSILFSDGLVNQYVNTVPMHQPALLSSYGDAALMLLIKVLLHSSCVQHAMNRIRLCITPCLPAKTQSTAATVHRQADLCYHGFRLLP